MQNIQALMQRTPISIPDIVQISLDSSAMLERVRGHMLAPDTKKVAPCFTISQLASMLDVDRKHLEYLVKKGELTGSEMRGNSRVFPISAVRALARKFRQPYLRPEGARAVVIAVGNFKGGVTKTTTTACLAQALTLKGQKVLIVDSDPQGSLSELFAVSPHGIIDDEMTLGPVLMDEAGESSLKSAIQKTYWDGIDIIPANTNLYAAEFSLPARQVSDAKFQFWDVLNIALEEVRDEYDVILIDTPPALSYLTINAFMAADALIVPLPPNNLDFASSTRFWNLFSDLSSSLMESVGLTKKFDFINILLSKVDTADAPSSMVREWIQATYGDKVLPVEVPKTTVTVAAANEFRTPYDIEKYDGNMKTYRRARDAYDRVADLVEQAVVVSWHQQIAESH